MIGPLREKLYKIYPDRISYFIYYLYIFFIPPGEFVTPALANDISKESELQHVSLRLQNSSQYAGQS